MAETKDWIVRYYASHDDIPEGKYDGHIVRELVRCNDCKHWYKGLNINYCRIFYDDNLKLYQSRPDDYCSNAERETDHD